MAKYKTLFEGCSAVFALVTGSVLYVFSEEISQWITNKIFNSFNTQSDRSRSGSIFANMFGKNARASAKQMDDALNCFLHNQNASGEDVVILDAEEGKDGVWRTTS